MKLAEVSVRRPVFAIMMTAALIVLGAFSYRDLGLDLMPKTDAANVNVQVQLPGASAEEVETQITEKQIKQVLETLKDVGAINLQGDRKREIQLLLNADRLNAYGLSVDQVRNAISRQNVEVP